MTVIGLDPGTEQSALVTYTGTHVASHCIESNAKILEWMRGFSAHRGVLVIEEFESYGMAVGREVFRTIRWAGNFEAAWFPARVEFLPRRIIKQHLCHTARATDANIRTELIDRFGGPQRAVGVKKAPGPLYGIKSHAWAALAVAVVWHDLHAHDGELIRSGVQAEF